MLDYAFHWLFNFETVHGIVGDPCSFNFYRVLDNAQFSEIVPPRAFRPVRICVVMGLSKVADIGGIGGFPFTDFVIARAGIL